MISVCMAAYNGEKYIKAQIESILCQLDKEDELIISDDGSTDFTIQIIEEIKDERIKLFHNNTHNYTRNFENAILHAAGDYILLSDQDDVWLENKVQEIINTFKRENCDMILTDAIVVDKDLEIIYPSYFNYCNIKKGFWVNFIHTRYIGACMAFNKKLKENILPFPSNDRFISHDYWITCVAEMKYHTYLLEKPLILYRRHDNNVSLGVEMKSNHPITERILKRFYMFSCLVSFIMKPKKCRNGEL